MEKNFDKWNKLKKEINKKKSVSFFNEREIVYVNLGLNIWFEQDWKNEKLERPMIVVKKFSRFLFVWVPLSTFKKDWKFYYSFNFKNKMSSAILSQIRLIDSKRIERKLWYIWKEDFENLKKELSDLIL